MKILFVSIIFRPELGALANRLYPITGAFVAAGHEVHVATGIPNYPKGVPYPGYEGRRSMTEEIDGVAVHRNRYVYSPRNKGKLRMILSYLSFMPAAFKSGLSAGKADVVYATSPPLFAIVPAVFLKRKFKSKLVMEVRDLWPDEFISVGAAKEGSLPVKLLRSLERWCYGQADIIFTVTGSMADRIHERGVPRDRIKLFPNGADLTCFRPMPRENPVASNLHLGHKFVVMYSGLLGLKFGLEMLLEVAKQLEDEPDILMVIRGEGPMEGVLKAEAKAMDLKNVRFFGGAPLQDVSSILARADVCVSCLPAQDYLRNIVSVKLYEYLACGRPVVAAVAGESAHMIESSAGGIVVPPGDSREMADAIRRLYRDPELAKRMGENGERYVKAEYSRAAVAESIRGWMEDWIDSTDRLDSGAALSSAQT